MKKHLKCKIDENEITNQKALEMAAGPVPTPKVLPKDVKEEKQLGPAINPPLPLDPPPPDSPLKPRPMLTIREKKDILKNPNDNGGQFNPEMIKNIKSENVSDNRPQMDKPTICRDFIRGTCSRPTTCKYAHVKDLDQLQKVYTFCHNFQNTECKFPNCKFVHATISEEQEFYRTAVLPPHTIAHHKKNISSQPVNINSPAKTPAMHLSSLPQGPPPRMPLAITPPVLPSTSSAHNYANNAGTPRWNGHEFCVAPEKHAKCDNCTLLQNRIVYTESKADAIRKTIDDGKKKMTVLDKKCERLTAMIYFLTKPKTDQQNEGQSSNDRVDNYNNSPQSLG